MVKRTFLLQHPLVEQSSWQFPPAYHVWAPDLVSLEQGRRRHYRPACEHRIVLRFLPTSPDGPSGIEALVKPLGEEHPCDPYLLPPYVLWVAKEHLLAHYAKPLSLRYIVSGDPGCADFFLPAEQLKPIPFLAGVEELVRHLPPRFMVSRIKLYGDDGAPKR